MDRGVLMARKVRIRYPGAIYHVMNRGDHMLKYMEQQKGKWHYGEELCESAEAKAERLVGEALRVDGVAEDELETWGKGHPYKMNLALRLRAETTVTVGWVAERLHMGTRGHLAHLLCKTRRGGASATQPTLGI